MRYKLDINGYVSLVLWGCHTGTCNEYTGEVPAGYSSLIEWADNACINAYYIDGNGNLVLDRAREQELNILHEQQAIDYAPVVHKEIYAQQEVLESQYLKTISIAQLPSVTNAKNIPPAVKIKGVSPGKVRIFAQTDQMLRNDMMSKEVSGVTFTKLADGMVDVFGTATDDIEYTLAGSNVNTEPLFALLKDKDYYLWTTNFECELRCFDGESIEQVYLGSGGVINLPENKEVTHVVIKIPKGTEADRLLAPTLYLGSAKGEWADSHTKVTTIDLSGFEITDIENAVLSIGGGLALLEVDGNISVVGQVNVQLLNGDNFFYTNQGNKIEIEYSKNVIDVESLEFMQGKSTKTDRFMVLPDGSIKAKDGLFSGTITGSTIKNENEEGTSKVELNLGDILLTEDTGEGGVRTTRLNGAGFRILSENPNNPWQFQVDPTGIVGLYGTGALNNGRVRLLPYGMIHLETGDNKVQLTPDGLIFNDKKMIDYAIEEGTKEIKGDRTLTWYYKKMASGDAFAYCYDTVPVACNKETGALYQGSINITLPSGLFTSCRNVHVTPAGSTGAGYAFFGRYVYYTTYINLLFLSTASATKDISYSALVVGRWK